MQEAERSLHDALCVIRCLVHKRFMIAGGAAAEVEVATQLSRWAKTLVVSSPLQLLSGKGHTSMLPVSMPSHNVTQVLMKLVCRGVFIHLLLKPEEQTG